MDFRLDSASYMIGFAITIGIAVGGFRTFGRWKREKLEEKKIEIAFEALSIAYETKFIFQTIRGPMSFEYEWKDMPTIEGEAEENRRERGPFFAILNRISSQKEFFERAWKLQPRFMAMFGPQSENIFIQLHQARRNIQVSASMLMRPDMHRNKGNWNENRQRQQRQMEGEIWEGMDEIYPGTDRVSKGLKRFEDEIVQLCRPVVDREFRTPTSAWPIAALHLF
jgi:hypothetical protein